MHFVSDTANNEIPCPPGENTAVHRGYYSSPTHTHTHTKSQPNICLDPVSFVHCFRAHRRACWPVSCASPDPRADLCCGPARESVRAEPEAEWGPGPHGEQMHYQTEERLHLPQARHHKRQGSAAPGLAALEDGHRKTERWLSNERVTTDHAVVNMKDIWTAICT